MRLRRHRSRDNGPRSSGSAYIDTQRYVTARNVVSGTVLSLVSLPLIVVGVLIINDVWNLGSAV